MRRLLLAAAATAFASVALATSLPSPKTANDAAKCGLAGQFCSSEFNAILERAQTVDANAASWSAPTWSSVTGKPASFTPPAATLTTIGGVKGGSCPAGQFVVGFDSGGGLVCATPASSSGASATTSMLATIDPAGAVTPQTSPPANGQRICRVTVPASGTITKLGFYASTGATANVTIGLFTSNGTTATRVANASVSSYSSGWNDVAITTYNATAGSYYIGIWSSADVSTVGTAAATTGECYLANSLGSPATTMTLAGNESTVTKPYRIEFTQTVTSTALAWQQFAAQVMGNNEGFPHGAVNPDTSWFDLSLRPILNCMPYGGEVPMPAANGYFVACGSELGTQVNGWGVIYEAADANNTNLNLATNTRVAIRNMEVWFRPTGVPTWTRILGPYTTNVEHALYDENLGGQNVYADDVRTEADGSYSVKLPYHGGKMWHVVTPSRTNVVPPAASLHDLGGFVVAYQARIVLDNAGGTNDLASARYVASPGADWYPADGVWDSLIPFGGGAPAMADGKFRLLTPSWRWISFSTLSAVDLQANPPPIDLSAASQ